MIIATINIGTICGDQLVPVEVLRKGPRPKTAWVRALGGLQPFLKYSPGGPFQDDTSVVPTPHLRDVHLAERSPAEDREGPTRPADGFLEECYENRTYVE